MKITILSAALATFMGASAVAAPVVPLADQPLYWGVGYSWIDFGQDAVAEDAATGALTGRFGYQYNEIFGGELRYIGGVAGDDAGGIEFELDRLVGIYGKANLLTDVNFTPYAIIGYTTGEMTARGAGMTASAEESGFSYGIGVDFCSDQPVCMNLDYLSYIDKDNFTTRGLTLGLRVNF